MKQYHKLYVEERNNWIVDGKGKGKKLNLI